MSRGASACRRCCRCCWRRSAGAAPNCPCCDACSPSSRPSASARPTSRCCRRMARRARGSWSCAVTGTSSPARSPRTRCSWMSSSTSGCCRSDPSAPSFAADLEARMEQLREEDPEQQVEALRQFQRAALFRVAVADLTGTLPLMQVSDRLTDIAELIVERALQLAWRQITALFGVPMCGDGALRRPGHHLRGRLRQARRHGTGLRLGPGSGVPARLARRAAGDRAARKPHRQPGVLRAPGAAHRAPADRAFGRRAALRGRRAAAPERQGRLARHQHRRLRRVPARGGVDLGAPGAAARARGGRRRRSCARASRRCACEVLCQHVRRDDLREEVRGMRERMRRELSAAGRAAISTSSRTRAGSPTSSSWRSTGR